MTDYFEGRKRIADTWGDLLITLAGEDPVERITRGQELLDSLLTMQADAAEVRRTAVRQLRMEGWKLREIAEATGLSHQRVSQIEVGADRKEKAG